MSNRLTNDQIKQALTSLRNDLRSGKTTVYLRDPENFPRVVTNYLKPYFNTTAMAIADADVFDKGCMAPQTVRRFKEFFAKAPNGGVSQDDIATAVQNFINRRTDIWALPASEQVSASKTDDSMLAITD